MRKTDRIDEDLVWPITPKMRMLSLASPASNFGSLSKVATERPFENAYWEHDAPGLYVDTVSGEPLFFFPRQIHSDCGWPSFTKPVDSENVEERSDNTYGMSRTEVRSSHADSHLGHVFVTAPRMPGDCAIASIRHLCASSLSTSLKAKATANMSNYLKQRRRNRK